MRKMFCLLLALLLAFPAHAKDETLKEDPQFYKEDKAVYDVDDIKNLLFAEQDYAPKRDGLIMEVKKTLMERFKCIGEKKRLNDQIDHKLQEVFAYQNMVKDLDPLLSDLTDADFAIIRNFYASETGKKWSWIMSQMPEASERAGKAMGEEVGKQVVPIIAMEDSCDLFNEKKSGTTPADPEKDPEQPAAGKKEKP